MGGLRSAECLTDLEHVRAPDHFGNGAEAQPSHELFGGVVEGVDDLFGLASKCGPK